MRNKKNNLFEYEDSEYNLCVANFLETTLFKLQAIKQNVNVALSGGLTPLPILYILSKSNLNWSKFSFFLVDERCVSLTDEKSNFKNLKKSFFNHIEANTYSIIDDNLNIEDSLIKYKSIINKRVDNENNFPSFDLILLGLGNDGHTASLFPETNALEESKEIVVKNYVKQLNSYRLTLTYPVLLNAKQIIVIAKGKEKKELIKYLFSSTKNNFPISKITEANTNLTWLTTI